MRFRINILFYGDHNAQDGVLISTLSLLKNVNTELHIYILTANVDPQKYQPFSKKAAISEYENAFYPICHASIICGPN